MQTKSDQGHEVEGDIARAEQPSVESSQPWWRGVTGFNASPGQLHGSAPTSPPFDSPDKGNGGSGDSLGQENCKNEERRSVNGEDREITSPAGSEGDYAKRQDVQSGTAVMPSVVAEYLVPHPQLELSQPMACAPYIFPETYYNGILSAYGAQPLVHSQLLGMPHTRMPLPLEMAEEPVYVNAKQYHGILRRRQSRAKAELENKLIKVRKPYLHESRHQHAMRRARGCGGRFLNTKKGDAHATEPATEKAPCSNGFQPVKPPTEGSESPPSSRPNNPPTQEARAPAVPDVCTAPTTYGRACETANFNLPAFRSISSDDRKEEGDCSGQQRSGMPVGQAASRAVII